jgi:DNA polymerase
VRSDIMIVGEAPGRQEDAQGMPFVGPAGELLWQELEQVGISQHTVFTANTVCCWPDGKPTDDEILACRRNLFAQLRYCEPLWVLALGRVANWSLGKHHMISRVHGQWYEQRLHQSEPEHMMRVFPTYHPSAILRNRTLARAWRRDLKTFAEVTLGYGYEEE